MITGAPTGEETGTHVKKFGCLIVIINTRHKIFLLPVLGIFLDDRR